VAWRRILEKEAEEKEGIWHILLIGKHNQITQKKKIGKSAYGAETGI